MNFGKFLRTLFIKEHLWWLLLWIQEINYFKTRYILFLFIQNEFFTTCSPRHHLVLLMCNRDQDNDFERLNFWLLYFYNFWKIYVAGARLYSLGSIQKQPSEVFYEKGVLRNFTKFTGKRLFQSLIFNNVACMRPAALLKKRLWHMCFPVNFVKFLRTPFFTENIWWLLLSI